MTAVGVFGGAFDPPHLGHAEAAARAADRHRLDRVLWVPSATAPHKIDRPATPGAVRRRMVEAAIQSHRRFELCELELERGGISYTVDTLRSLSEQHPEWSLRLLVGADLLDGLPQWREAAAIAQLAELVVLPREPSSLSSSRIRDRIRRGRGVAEMVAPAVLIIIRNEGLYVQPRARRREAGPAQAG